MAVKTILFKSKKLKSGKHPITLYIYEDKKHYVSLGESCLPEEWDEKQGRFRRNYPNYKTKNLILRQQELKASEIIDDFIRHGQRFNIDEFKLRFSGKEIQEKTFYEFFEEMIEEKNSLGKVGTMMAYKDAYSTIKKFKKGNIKFSEINYALLKGLEVHLFKKGCMGGGIGARMRAIRAVYYEGIRRGLVSRELNPFSTTMNKQGYSMSKLKSNPNPRALSTEDLEKFKKFDCITHAEHSRTHKFFMFSFYMFGMNFADICRLTKSNLHNGRLIYTRQKTGKSFNLNISKDAQEIIDSFSSEGDYLFPIYNENIHKTNMQKKNRSMKVLKQTNRGLKEIAKLLKIETHITFYTARHTSATTLKRKGVSTEIISEALGHSNSQITQFYLKQFDNKVLDGAMAQL